MKTTFYLFLLFLISSMQLFAQKGAKIGYINMEYILEKNAEYAEANKQLENNIQAWKKEIDKKKSEIEKLKKSLASERPLLTKELIDDSEEEIKFQENELFDYQENIFGSTGLLTTQKSNLVKPIQDQVFNVIQDIAIAKKYDFIFDKSADVIMLFAAKRFDISEQVVRAIARANKKEKLSKKQQKELDAKDSAEAMAEENPQMSEKQLKIDALKKKRDDLQAERKKMLEEKKLERENKKQKIKGEKETDSDATTVKESETKPEDVNNKETLETDDAEPVANKLSKTEEFKKKRDQLLEERKQLLEKKKQELEARRKKIIEEKEAKKNKTKDTITVGN